MISLKRGIVLFSLVVVWLAWRNQAPYYSVERQVIHYFSRPGIGRPTGTIESKAAWYGHQLQNMSHLWRYNLNQQEKDEILSEVRKISTILEDKIEKRIDKIFQDKEKKFTKEKERKREQLKREEMGKLVKKDFNYLMLDSAISTWRTQVSKGLGFQVIRGVPVEKMTQFELEIFFWSFGLFFGTPGAQNGKGELLGHVSDTHDYKSTEDVREYRTPIQINFHADAADVVGLLSISRPESGGTSRILSSVTVYNEMVKKYPDSLEVLFRTVPLDIRGDGGIDWIPIVPLRYSAGKLRTFYHSTYFWGAEKYPTASVTEELKEAYKNYDSICHSSGVALDMDFLVGDIQLISNHEILHSRTAFVDTPEHTRHLLRLWLSLDFPHSFGEHLSIAAEQVKMVSNLAWKKLGLF